MKKKLFKILSVIMTLLLFVGIGVGVNAYTIESNGNIVSDNLCGIQDYSDTNVNVNNNNISLTGQSNFNWIPLKQTINTSQTIHVQLFGTGNLNAVEIMLAHELANYDDRQRIMAYDEQYTYNLSWDINYIFIYNQSGNVNNLNIMISYSNITNYEPYGTFYSESNSQIKQAIGTLANTNNIVVDLLESGEIYNSETYSNFFDLPFTTSYGQLTIPVNIFENWNESQHPNAVGNITFNYSNGIVPTNTYGTIYIIRWDYYTEITITYYDGTSQRYQSTGDSIQITNPSSTYIKSIKFDTSEDLGNYSPITFALDNNYSAGYEQGYSNGNQTGYQNGYTAGSTGKYQEGYNNGYNEGYEQGYEDNPEDKTLYNMVLAIADVPITLFTQIFNFDILGVNIAGFVTSLVSIAIIVWLVKFFI